MMSGIRESSAQGVDSLLRYCAVSLEPMAHLAVEAQQVPCEGPGHPVPLEDVAS